MIGQDQIIVGAGPFGYVRQPRRRFVSDIQRGVADYYRIPVEEMTSVSRAQGVSRPRQVAMYLSAHLTRQSTKSIGRRFHRDHTTVIHAVRQVEKLRQDDVEFDADVRALEGML